MKYTETLEIGEQVVLNDKPFPAVFKVVAKHPRLNSYSVAYTTLTGRVASASVFIDIGAIERATPEQIEHHNREQARDRLDAGINFAS
jgi:hypothetical protein